VNGEWSMVNGEKLIKIDASLILDQLSIYD